MQQQFLQIAFQLQVSLLNLLIVMLIHIALPVALVYLLGYIGFLELFGHDGILELSSFELCPR